MKLKSAASARRCPLLVSHPSNDRSYPKQFEANNERRLLSQSGAETVRTASVPPPPTPTPCARARLLFLHATLISFDQKCINNSSEQLNLFTYWCNYCPAVTSVPHRPRLRWRRRLFFNDGSLRATLAMRGGCVSTTVTCILRAT